MTPTGGDPEGRFWNKSHMLQGETSLFSCHSQCLCIKKQLIPQTKRKSSIFL